MDAPEPEQTPFAAVTAHTTKLQRHYQALLDQSTPFVLYRWVATGATLLLFFVRIFVIQGWYIGMLRVPGSTFDGSPFHGPLTPPTVAYALGIYLLNLFLAFLQPKFDPSNDAVDQDMEDGAVGTLPTKQDDEFKPFIRRLPEFKFWYWATRAIAISFFCTFFEFFNIPVFWPVLVMYWIILFVLTMRKQIQHMIKYRYVPFTMGKKNYRKDNS
ncbi:RER1 protein [Metarhizium acridum CQMa 102]|uniref:Protein RER1 n=1 Tax=Metarhizium acridum (strain CQMa 102) TaxID=655827 RepID=E9E1J5_METAQ|nr:RER1 protein [Metarhizium acridum CQMa 102]EFY90228.1 RER1 protein [Metarhizium acridum CQMa 102]